MRRAFALFFCACLLAGCERGEAPVLGHARSAEEVYALAGLRLHPVARPVAETAAATPAVTPRIEILPADKPEPKTEAAAVEGLEASPGWTCEAWGAPLTIRQAAVEGATGTALVLALSADGEKKEKSAACHTLPAPQALNQIRFDAKLEGEVLAVALALRVGAKKEYVESAPQALQSGWNRGLTFDPSAKTWKSEASGWKAEIPVPGGQVEALWLLIYPARPGASVTIDALNLTRAD